MTEAFENWWLEHYSMANLAMGAASDAWDAATAAERERCAKIAEQTAQNADDFAATHFDRPSLDFQRWSEGCRQVATAIRTPSTTGEET